MWIERIYLAGFGSVVGEKIEFEPNKLNLVVEANEFGKSTMATAVLAALFDFPETATAANSAFLSGKYEREGMRPRAGSHLPFKVTLWANLDGRRLQIERDFAAKTLHVYETEPVRKDVTSEFMGPQGEDEVGFRLTGMTRELFRSTCFVGQRELDEHTIGGDSNSTSIFQGIADSSNSKHTAHAAITCLDSALSQYPHRGNRQKIDQVIHQLELEHRELTGKIEALEEDRKNLFNGLYYLDQMGDDASDTEEGDTTPESSAAADMSTDAMVLQEERKDLEPRILKAKQMQTKISELQKQVDAINPPGPDFANLETSVRELWTKRDSLHAEHERMKADPNNGNSTEVDILEAAFQKKFRGLSEFTAQDAQSLSLLVMRLSDLGRDLNSLSNQKKEETDRLTSSQVDLAKYESTKTVLSALDTKDAGDARSYHALMNAAKDQIQECERSVIKYRASILEIEKQRQEKRSRDLIYGGIALGAAILFGLAAFFTHEMFAALVSLGLMAVLTGVAAGYYLLRWMKPEYYRKKDVDKLEADLEKSIALAQQLHTKIGSLEVKLETIARKAGVSNGPNLLAMLDERTHSEPKLKTIDALASEIAQKEGQRERAFEELSMFFKKANIPVVEISLERAKRLSDDVASAVEEGRSIQTATWQQRQMLQQIGTMQSEIEELEKELSNVFLDFGFNDITLEDGYRSFEKSMDAHYSAKKYVSEISRIREDLLSGTAFSDVSLLVEHLENKDEALKKQLSILNGAPSAAPASTKSPASQNSEERNALVMQVRLAAKSLDDNYLPILDEVEIVARELNNARHHKLTLELARNTLRKLSGETYETWAQKLNTISEEMTRELNLEFESVQFTPELNLLIKRRGESEQIDSSQFSNRMSVGVREQLHWFARIVVSRFLAKSNPLPIVLDEPFSESDDDRFLRIMQFVVDVLTREHQIIIFSCHRQRHQWLAQELGPEQKDRLSFCQRVKADAQTLGAENYAERTL